MLALSVARLDPFAVSANFIRSRQGSAPELAMSAWAEIRICARGSGGGGGGRVRAAAGVVFVSC